MPVMQDGNPAPTSDQHLQKITVGGRRPHNATVTLAEYDPGWPGLFDREAGQVRAALGRKALQVEHVGSTSVPGLCAKPIIDMLLVVADSADEPSYAPALEAAGYTLRIREPEWYEHRKFTGPDVDINLHVFSAGSSEIRRMLRFRDWLRANEADRENYARAKRSLAGRVWRHVQHYAQAKTPTIHEILARAQAAERGTRPH
ncbi:MAG: GrpB family protein [Bacillota bacterium]